MKAMILAAGLGTRLRPLTNDRPKALVTVAGRTLLEIALCRLREFGVREVIVNVHHYAESVCRYLKDHGDFGMHVEVSREETLLDTGGGLKKTSAFFLHAQGGSQEPFLLHNVDVISTIDLDRMIRFHLEQGALATLAVQKRETSRYLLFDEMGRPALEVQTLAFSGIHVISPALFTKMNEEGAFSIIAAYLRLAAEGEDIVAFRADDFYWCDVGRPESVQQAARDLASGAWSEV
jgi:NDP-sugar pyrophosphorylase family protein